MSEDEKTVTFSGIIVGADGVIIHPEFWEELAQAPPEVQLEVKELIKTFQKAAQITTEKYGSDARQEDFERELHALTGLESEEVTEENVGEEVFEKIVRRTGNFPTRH